MIPLFGIHLIKPTIVAQDLNQLRAGFGDTTKTSPKASLRAIAFSTYELNLFSAREFFSADNSFQGAK